MAEAASGARPAVEAVFLCGASRSGTALLRGILNRNPGVFLAGETHYFDDLRLRLPGGGQTPLDESWQRICEDYFLALSHRPYGHGGQAARARLDRRVLRELAHVHGGTADAYFLAYCQLSRTFDEDGGGQPAVWGEKTPRHVFRLPEILTDFPRAAAVCLYRDPRGVVASYRGWRNQGGFDLDEDPGHRDALEDEQRRTQASYDPSVASLLWKATVAAGRQAQRRFGERVLLVRYEDLVAEPEKTVQRLCEDLGLDYTPAMLDVPLHNSSFAAFSRAAGVSAGSVDRWRQVLSPREISLVQMWCRRELQDLGYALEPAGLTPRDRVLLPLQLPVSFARVAMANRHRMGRMGQYVWRRARLVLSARRG